MEKKGELDGRDSSLRDLLEPSHLPRLICNWSPAAGPLRSLKSAMDPLPPPSARSPVHPVMASRLSRPSRDDSVSTMARYTHPNLVVSPRRPILSTSFEMPWLPAVFHNASPCATRSACIDPLFLPHGRGGGGGGRESSRLRTGTASIQSPNHNNAVVDVWQSARSINIGSKYVIPDIAGGHLICSLYIIPRYGTRVGASPRVCSSYPLAPLPPATPLALVPAARELCATPLPV